MVTLHEGDCRDVLRTLAAQSVHCCVTSPPYFGLRDYGVDRQIGMEPQPQEYVAAMVAVFREVRRVLRDDGTLWLNLGDSYSTRGGGSVRDEGRAGFNGDDRKRYGQPKGTQHKQLLGMPWRVAFALQADGWYLRQDIIWNKPNPMPESVRDRCTKAHEYLFLLAKSPRYYFDADAIKEAATSRAAGNRTHKYATAYEAGDEGERHRTKAGLVASGGVAYETRNKRSVWTVPPKPYRAAHFATYPPELIRPCILAGCPAAGKRCDCDEVIGTPTGDGVVDDPSLVTGRAGMNRPRRENEGTRPITRRQQRHDALTLRDSPHRSEIEAVCGAAFAHYIRTDRSGGRPLPADLRAAFVARGWMTDATPCDCPTEEAGVVLDPFAGAGTTMMVAAEEGRQSIGVELSPAYCELIEDRIGRDRVVRVRPSAAPLPTDPQPSAAASAAVAI